MVESVTEFLSEKLGEYRVMSAPLERASRELDYANQLLRARIESEIAEQVPVLGAVADILDLSILELLLAPDRNTFLRNALVSSGMTSEELVQQLRALGPPAGEELNAIGLS